MSEVCALGEIFVKLLFSSLFLYTFHHVVRKIVVWKRVLNMFLPSLEVVSLKVSKPKGSYPVLTAS